jgi:hypothetical protein
VIPGPLRWLAIHGSSAAGVSYTGAEIRGLELFTYIWLAGCMGVAFLAKSAETRWLGRFTSPALIYIGGYGPLLCAITTAAYIKEHRRAEVRWEKTEKTGKVSMPA